MGKTSIEWTDASWNPIVGCTEISPGCANCYAARLAATRLKETPSYKGLAILKNHKPGCAGGCHSRWTGEVRFLHERLEEPLHWRKPRRIFVCDMGDLFHEAVHEDWIDHVLSVIQRCPQHTFQILTKRPDLMHDFLSNYIYRPNETALPNVWLGVSVENQHFADERIPLLLDTPAAVRWISAEPLLGPVKMRVEWMNGLRFYKQNGHDATALDGPHLNWVVCGGESGTGARPMHPDWSRSLRDQCLAVRGGVTDPPGSTNRGPGGPAFFFKQWGEWKTVSSTEDRIEADLHPCQTLLDDGGSPWLMMKCGKKKAGRLLDGREWNEFPNAPPVL